MSEKKFYVYLHRYASGPKEGQVFYVGKGTSDRYLNKFARSEFWKRVVNKYGFNAEIVMHFENETCAFSFERALIKFYGRSNLVNLSDGGKGGSFGSVRSKESRLKMSELMKGNQNAKGNIPTEETRKKISETKTKDKNNNYDKSIYRFRHEAHGDFYGTQVEFRDTFFPGNSNVSGLITGRVNTFHGWWIGDGPKPKRDYSKERVNRKIGKLSARKNLKNYVFFHPSFGFRISNLPDFSYFSGADRSQIHRMVKGKCSICKGWVFIEPVNHT
jgi:hypothetical protein